MTRGSSGPKKGPSQRQLQVGEELRHALVGVLQRGGFNHPLLLDGSRITVSEVKISPDLKNATAYVMTLGGTDFADVLNALNETAPQIQYEIGHKIRLKFMPRLRFSEDTSFAYADKIERLLKKADIKQDDE